MKENLKSNSLGLYIRKSFDLCLLKLSALSKSRLETKSEKIEDSQLEEYQIDINQQQNLHPYLIDRVEPSVQHIIFSSYIRF